MSLRALAGAVLVSAVAATAVAAPAPALPRVLLVRPAAAPPAVSEALVRLRGELVAAGFDADVIELPLGADVRASLERLAPPTPSGGSASALVAVVASPDPGTAELWVIDRVTGKTVVRRVSAPAADPARAAEVLAVRAVELLRASFLELAIAPPAAEPAAAHPAAPEAPVAPAVERWATAPLEERDWTWAIEAGGGTAAAVGGPWNAFLAVARVERSLGRRFCVRLAFAGLGTSGSVDASNGSADVSQTVLLAEVLVRFRRGHRLEPLISIGAGALRAAVDAHEVPPYQAVGGARWGAAGDLGVGLRVPLHRRRFEIGAEVHALLAQPYPTVQYFGQEIASVGRPTLLATLTLLGGF
jgi:hypothetical protein